MDWLKLLLEDRVLVRDIVATLVVVLLVVLLRAAAVRTIGRIQWAKEESRLRWRAQVRGAVVVILVVPLALIWATELRTVALSFVAVAVAFVVAMKELILCAMGSLYRLSSGAFAIGDRVSFGDVRGDVVDIGLFSTKLSEVGPSFGHTGRAVVVPNSLFLSSTIVNESEGGSFILHEIEVPLSDRDDWREAEARLLDIAIEVCGGYIESMRTSLLAMSSHHEWGVPTEQEPRAQPTVSVQFAAAGALKLNLRVPVPARSKGRIEQKIVRAFIEQRPIPTA